MAGTIAQDIEQLSHTVPSSWLESENTTNGRLSNLRKRSKPKETIAEYRTAIRIKPELALAHYNLGIALEDQGNLEEAITEYRTAIRIKPELAMAHYNLGVGLDNQGKRDEAIAELRKARDHAQRGSKLAQLIEKALTDVDH